uniref:non-specific serine/threonine protein kinase n=1 Tax=Accipiter nisus TaxID=211598 RepID=A0A8B9LZA5_9AVES
MRLTAKRPSEFLKLMRRRSFFGGMKSQETLKEQHRAELSELEIMALGAPQRTPVPAEAGEVPGCKEETSPLGTPCNVAELPSGPQRAGDLAELQELKAEQVGPKADPQEENRHADASPAAETLAEGQLAAQPGPVSTPKSDTKKELSRDPTWNSLALPAPVDGGWHRGLDMGQLVAALDLWTKTQSFNSLAEHRHQVTRSLLSLKVEVGSTGAEDCLGKDGGGAGRAPVGPEGAGEAEEMELVEERVPQGEDSLTPGVTEEVVGGSDVLKGWQEPPAGLGEARERNNGERNSGARKPNADPLDQVEQEVGRNEEEAKDNAETRVQTSPEEALVAAELKLEEDVVEGCLIGDHNPGGDAAGLGEVVLAREELEAASAACAGEGPASEEAQNSAKDLPPVEIPGPVEEETEEKAESSPRDNQPGAAHGNGWKGEDANDGELGEDGVQVAPAPEGPSRDGVGEEMSGLEGHEAVPEPQEGLGGQPKATKTVSFGAALVCASSQARAVWEAGNPPDPPVTAKQGEEPSPVENPADVQGPSTLPAAAQPFPSARESRQVRSLQVTWPREPAPLLTWAPMLGLHSFGPSELKLLLPVAQEPASLQRTVKKTRRFVVDGEEVSVTTARTIGKAEARDEMVRSARRQELHELRVLQKEEQRAQSQLEQKFHQQREQMFRHIEQEMTSKKDFYDREMESLERRYQQLKERQELQYTVRLQDEAKRLKSLQEKNCRRRMEELKGDGREEQRFLQQQQEELNAALQKVVQEHKKKMTSIDWECINKIHSLRRARESVVWNMEQGHLQEKYQLFRQQVKEQHALQRQQLRKRHEKETERMNRFHQLLLEDLKSQQAQEQAQLLKSQRCDAKIRLALFKDNLKIQEANGAKQRERAKQVQGPIRGQRGSPAQSMGEVPANCKPWLLGKGRVTWAVPHRSSCSRRRGGSERRCNGSRSSRRSSCSSCSSSRPRAWQSWSRCRYWGPLQNCPRRGLPTPLLPLLEHLSFRFHLPSPRARRCTSWQSRRGGSWGSWTRSTSWSSASGSNGWLPARRCWKKNWGTRCRCSGEEGCTVPTAATGSSASSTSPPDTMPQITGERKAAAWGPVSWLFWEMGLKDLKGKVRGSCPGGDEPWGRAGRGTDPGGGRQGCVQAHPRRAEGAEVKQALPPHIAPEVPRGSLPHWSQSCGYKGGLLALPMRTSPQLNCN